MSDRFVLMCTAFYHAISVVYQRDKAGSLTRKTVDIRYFTVILIPTVKFSMPNIPFIINCALFSFYLTNVLLCETIKMHRQLLSDNLKYIRSSSLSNFIKFSI